jgi:hypothetical protein
LVATLLPTGVTERSDEPEADHPEPEDPTPSGPADPTPETPEQAVPEQEIPAVGDNYDSADPALQAWFWKIVLLLKLSVIGITLGSLLLWFQADYERGGALFAGGAVLFAYTVREARQLKAQADAGEFDHDTPGETEPTEVSTD